MGCEACANVCPVAAIAMVGDAEGFLYPEVDLGTCTLCDACNVACPAQHGGFRSNSRSRPFAAWNLDGGVRSRSSSGGVFHALASAVLRDGGRVFGAAFDERFDVAHRVAEDEAGLEALLGSKYVQSRIGSTLADVRRLLDRGTEVLFSGTPCQVSGLYGFLGGKPDRLVTVDILCHGVPSPMAWRRYREERCRGDVPRAVSFRDKARGWKHYSVAITTSRGRAIELGKANPYLQGFLKDLYCRPACAACIYNTLPRIADVSLGDFWRVGKYRRDLDDDRGTSLVFSNGGKGWALLERAREGLFLREAPRSRAIASNAVLVRPMAADPAKRAAFFSSLAVEGTPFRDAVRNGTLAIDSGRGRRVALMNFHYSPENYGALMVSYALQRTVERLGYEPRNVDWVPRKWRRRHAARGPFQDFRDGFLELTAPCRKEADLRRVAGEFDKFVVGSDQVWRSHDRFRYFLRWVSGRKVLVAYAASFGMSAIKQKAEWEFPLRYLLSRFDAISVRERSGIEICADAGARAVKMPDPTLLLSPEDYGEVLATRSAPEPPGPYVGFMALDPELERRVEQGGVPWLAGLGLPIVNLRRGDGGALRPFGDWMGLLAGAAAIVTDSFHGTVFSIQFGRRFVVVSREAGGDDRVRDLLEDLGLPLSRFVPTIDAFSAEELLAPIDYGETDSVLARIRSEGQAFLARALALPPVDKASVQQMQRAAAISSVGLLRVMASAGRRAGKLLASLRRRLRAITR